MTTVCLRFHTVQNPPPRQMLAMLRQLEAKKYRFDPEDQTEVPHDIVAHVLPWCCCPTEIERQLYANRPRPVFWKIGGDYLKVFGDYLETFSVDAGHPPVLYLSQSFGVSADDSDALALNFLTSANRHKRARRIERHEYMSALQRLCVEPRFRVSVLADMQEGGERA